MPDDIQDKLATLRRWHLEQDNSGPFRVYREEEANKPLLLVQTLVPKVLFSMTLKEGPLKTIDLALLAVERLEAHMSAMQQLQVNQQTIMIFKENKGSDRSANSQNIPKWFRLSEGPVPGPICPDGPNSGTNCGHLARFSGSPKLFLKLVQKLDMFLDCAHFSK